MDAALIKGPEGLEELSTSWDTAPPSRGEHADPYDSLAWLLSWAVADPAGARSLACPVVVDGSGLVAALPMTARRSSWRHAGAGWRPRYRVVCRGQGLDDGVADRLVQQALGHGARRLELSAMPARDPATDALERALVRAGCHVARRPGSVECLARVERSWDEHRRRFKKYERTVKNFSNKASRLGDLAWREEVGAAGALPAVAWQAYADLHARGWKGPLREPMATHRRALFERLTRLGWLRVYTLGVAGVPAAAIVWFRVGGVAVAYSTVYDTRLAALSAGTIAMWRAHEELAREGPVALFDYLPGRGPQKDQLGVDRAPLVNLVARRPAWIGWCGDAAFRAARSLRARLPRPGRAGRGGPGGAGSAGSAGEAVSGRFEPEASEAEAAGWPVAPLEPGPTEELYLVVAGGHPSAKRMREAWPPGDGWWALGEPVRALARAAPASEAEPVAVREVVLTPGDTDPEAVLRRLARHLGSPVATCPDGSGPGAIPVRRSPLPWPGGDG